MGKLSWTLLISLISAIHFSWSPSSLAERPMTLTLRASHSSWRAATRPSSVVQTGAIQFSFCQSLHQSREKNNLLKSAGWEKRTVHFWPTKSWNLISPLVVWASKSMLDFSSLALLALSSSLQPYRFKTYQEQLNRVWGPSWCMCVSLYKQKKEKMLNLETCTRLYMLC